MNVSGWTFKSTFDLPAPWFETSPIAGATIDAAPVGSMLFVGDSVGESIAAEFNGIVRPAYPNVNYQALSNRCMVGPSCVAAASGKPDALRGGSVRLIDDVIMKIPPRKGGTIVAVVDDFVGNVAQDKRINAYFAKTDIAHL